MNRSATNHQVVQPKQAGSGQEPTNIQRRTVIGGALAALLSFPGRITYKNAISGIVVAGVIMLSPLLLQTTRARTNDNQDAEVTVVQGPNLGLSMVDLNDEYCFCFVSRP